MRSRGSGFTLLEILIAIAIMATMAVLAYFLADSVACLPRVPAARE
jgi:type II secretion system protein J